MSLSRTLHDASHWKVTNPWCNSNNMSLNVSKTKLMYISSRHKHQTLANCDQNISISKIQVGFVEQLLGVTISNTLCWDAHNSYLFLLSRVKVFTVVLHWKINL